jgi:hypothetical protein
MRLIVPDCEQKNQLQGITITNEQVKAGFKHYEQQVKEIKKSIEHAAN